MLIVVINKNSLNHQMRLPSNFWIFGGKIYFSHYNNRVLEERLYQLSLFRITSITIQFYFDYSILSITMLFWFITYLVKTNTSLSFLLFIASLYPLAHAFYFRMVWILLDGSYIFRVPFYKIKQARIIRDSIYDALFK